MKNIRIYLFSAVILLTGFFWISCQKSSSDQTNNALARVGSELLTIEQAKKQIPDFVLREDSITALQQYREDWIRQQLLLQEANRLGLSQKKKYSKNSGNPEKKYCDRH